MNIADLELEIVATPGDLEHGVQDLTGATPGEVRNLLDGHCLAGFVAKALHPFIAGGHELAELARKIAEHGVDAIKGEVAKLYDTAIGDGAPAAEDAPAAAVVDGEVSEPDKGESQEEPLNGEK